MRHCDRCAEMRAKLRKALAAAQLVEATKIAGSGLKAMIAGHDEEDHNGIRSSDQRMGKPD